MAGTFSSLTSLEPGSAAKNCVLTGIEPQAVVELVLSTVNKVTLVNALVNLNRLKVLKFMKFTCIVKNFRNFIVHFFAAFVVGF